MECGWSGSRTAGFQPAELWLELPAPEIPSQLELSPGTPISRSASVAGAARSSKAIYHRAIIKAIDPAPDSDPDPERPAIGTEI